MYQLFLVDPIVITREEFKSAVQAISVEVGELVGPEMKMVAQWWDLSPSLCMISSSGIQFLYLKLQSLSKVILSDMVA